MLTIFYLPMCTWLTQFKCLQTLFYLCTYRIHACSKYILRKLSELE